MRKQLLKALLPKCPEGDLHIYETDTTFRISCVFVFYGRYDLMSNILHCLKAQDFPKNEFEIILVEDRGGSDLGRLFKKNFYSLNISYFAPDQGWGKMGFMRNFGLSKSRGEIILFLDDDTVITDPSFLSKLYHRFKQSPHPDAVMPLGSASYSLIKGRYNYHDPHFFTNRCMAYTKKCMIALKGFDSGFSGQEDVELAIRFIFNEYIAKKSYRLNYFHPPLVYQDTSKGYSVGASFADSKYSFWFKLILLANGSRWIFRYLFPGLKNKYMVRFAIGFFKGFVQKLFNPNKHAEYI